MASQRMVDGLAEMLEQRWWLVALRGLAGILFGILCFVSPSVAGFSLLFVFAIYSIVDGGFGLAAAYGKARRGERWVWLAIEAVTNIVIGVLMFAMPGFALTFVFLLIAIRTIVSGLFLLLAAMKLDGEHGRGLLMVSGLLNLAFAVLLFAAPMLGLKILIWWIGAWAILFGILLLALGFRLRTAAQRMRG
jgi:uncharacterized membrane protein HdeD (DUF308 family)